MNIAKKSRVLVLLASLRYRTPLMGLQMDGRYWVVSHCLTLRYTRIRTDENEADLKSEVDTAEESRLVDGTS